MKANFYQLTGGFVAALVSILALIFGWHWALSIIVIAGANLYVFVFFVECGLRSTDSDERPAQKKIIELPTRFWAPFQLLFLSFAFIPGFANLYIHTGAVLHSVTDKRSGDSRQLSTKNVTHESRQDKPSTDEPEYLTDKLDAFYFSFVTITSLGFGDYAPASPQARLVVIWELFTTVQLILFAFPLIISRLGDF